MKAIVQDRYGGPEHLRLADIPVPEPVRSQIRVRVLACAVNLSDWEYLIGSPLYARLVGGLMKPKRQVLGSDIVGVTRSWCVALPKRGCRPSGESSRAMPSSRPSTASNTSPSPWATCQERMNRCSSACTVSA